MIGIGHRSVNMRGLCRRNVHTEFVNQSLILITMNPCRHQNLVLLAAQTDRVRCRHCHLTIKSDQLGAGYCPECYETTGSKRYDFDKVAEPAVVKVQYQCEDCGLLIQGE